MNQCVTDNSEIQIVGRGVSFLKGLNTHFFFFDSFFSRSLYSPAPNAPRKPKTTTIIALIRYVFASGSDGSLRMVAVPVIIPDETAQTYSSFERIQVVIREVIFSSNYVPVLDEGRVEV